MDTVGVRLSELQHSDSTNVLSFGHSNSGVKFFVLHCSDVCWIEECWGVLGCTRLFCIAQLWAVLCSIVPDCRPLFQPLLTALGLYRDPTDLVAEDLGKGHLYDVSRLGKPSFEQSRLHLDTAQIRGHPLSSEFWIFEHTQDIFCCISKKQETGQPCSNRPSWYELHGFVKPTPFPNPHFTLHRHNF